MISLRERAGALSERPFRLLWLGQTTSAIGDVMIGVALAFAVFQIGGGAAQLGLVARVVDDRAYGVRPRSAASGPTGCRGGS